MEKKKWYTVWRGKVVKNDFPRLSWQMLENIDV